MLDPEDAVDQIQATFRPPPGHRTLHAKGSFFEGTFTASAEATALCAAAHLSGADVPVVVRWSNAGGTPAGSDAAPDIRGMAVKFTTEAGETDLLGQTSPRFVSDDPEVFVALVEPSVHQWKLPAFLVRHPSVLAPLVAGMRAGAIGKHLSYAEIPYYPIHAYGWIDATGARTWVRYELRPVATRDDRLSRTFSGHDRLREEIVARLSQGPVAFDLRVTVAGPGDDPHSAVSVWTGARDFVAGRIVVTGPTEDPETDGGVVVFDPTRIIDGLELSDDPILRYRPSAYSVSVGRRQGVEKA